MGSRFSLTARITWGAALAAVLVLGCAFFYVRVSLAELFQREGNRELQETATAVVERLNDLDFDTEAPDPEEAPDSKPPAEPRMHIDRGILMDVEKVFLRITDHGGKTLVESEGLAKLLPQDRLPPVGDWTWKDVDGPTGGHFLVYATRWNEGWVLATWDIRYENRLLHKSQNLLLLALGLATLLTTIVVALLTRRGLAPLQALAEHADGIHPGALQLPLNPDSLPAELATLARKLQEALARLDEAFHRLGTLNADLAHELRTPLHGIRLELEGLLRDGVFSEPEAASLEGTLETLDHLSATLDQMLFLARAEDPAMALRKVPLVASALARSAVAPFEPIAEERNIRLELRVPEDLALVVDETLTRRALHNLLSNAVRHAPEGSTVSLEALGLEQAVLLQVRDEGEGIPPEFLARIGQRFVRPDFSRSRATGGAGLGLAIVQRILELHGGTLEIESEPGKGTLARLRFPQ